MLSPADWLLEVRSEGYQDVVIVGSADFDEGMVEGDLHTQVAICEALTTKVSSLEMKIDTVASGLY